MVDEPSTPRPSIEIPSWRQLASGLWTPGSLTGVAVPVRALPGEIADLVAQPGLVAPRRVATSFDQVAIKPTEVELGLDPLPPAELISLVTELPFSLSAIGIARLTAALWHAGTDGTAQFEASRFVFGDSLLMQRYAAFLRAEPNRVMFSEQQLFLTLRLLVLHADGVTTADRLRPEQMATLVRVLLAAGTWADIPSVALDTTTSRRDLLAYFVQNGSFYMRSNPFSLLARTFAMFVELPEEYPEVMEGVSFETWIGEASPLGLEEQLSI